jgi:hypothetical protein
MAIRAGLSAGAPGVNLTSCFRCVADTMILLSRLPHLALNARASGAPGV